ncbi:L,D-transpeptidase [Catenulispora pinisilvae]|uniref:L,D-transpeptidase n=1 Tax=Catenulispora pinisilvae TaxID=2705253 RepID=UPI0018910B6C|nr:Ig-like domain-containing protein [Catenulispora pinisilvae]
MRRLHKLAVAVAVVGLTTAACGGGGNSQKTATVAPVANGSSTSPSAGTSGGTSQSSASSSPSSSASTSAAPALVVIKPAGDGSDVDPASQIQVSVANGKLTSVTAQLSGGSAVDGTLDPSGASWTSANPVGIDHTYKVTAIAMGDNGKAQTVTSQFSTASPDNTYAGTYTPDPGTTYGIAQPVSITFDKSIPDRAAVEKQLTVTSDPPVAGSWHWFGSERVDWRPQQYWAPGTKVTLHMRLDGVKSGSLYGKQNRDVTFTIGRSLIATMDADTKKMTVVTGGKTTTLLTSSGKPGFETWNGTMVVLEKDQDISMNSDTVGIFGVNAYDIPNVYWDVRLTPSGTFVHAAPWNAGKFGNVNGSHGCIGMSTDDAEWFFNQVIPGDPVTVVNSKDTVRADNGFGDWNLSWSDWIAGSALPH